MGILGFNSPEWFISDVAAIFAGCVFYSFMPLIGLSGAPNYNIDEDGKHIQIMNCEEDVMITVDESVIRSDGYRYNKTHAVLNDE